MDINKMASESFSGDLQPNSSVLAANFDLTQAIHHAIPLLQG
jgi:hypothetical protein